jgi:4-hydroxy-3-polyprenylbenzoate decarboxylase
VKGSSLPVAVNILGSENRMAWALGEHTLKAVERRVERLVLARPPRSLREGWELAKAASELRFLPPRKVRTGPVREVIEPEVDLSRLPVLTTWPDDAGPFITWPMVFTRGANGVPNCGMYRMQVFDSRTTGMHWQRQKDGRRHLDENGGRIPVAVALGGPPVLTWSATAPLPPEIFEMLLAGFLQRRRVPMVTTPSGLSVPAESDIVLEGYVDANDLRLEGPFGDHTGYYSQAGMYPAFHVQRVTRRADAIFPATVVGLPPKEDAYMGLATERLFLPLLKRVHGEIHDMHLPIEGVFHNLAVVSIRKRFPAHAHKTFHAIWGTGQMMFTKVAVAVDHDVDPANPRAVLAALDKNWHAVRDTVLSSGPADTLDHAAATPDISGKIGLDATARNREDDGGIASLSGGDWGAAGWEFPVERFPEVQEARLPPEAEGRVLLLRIRKEAPGAGKRLLESIREHDLSPRILFAVVFDEEAPLESSGLATTVAGNNIDPARDCVVVSSPRPGLALGVDATRKRADEGYPRGEWPRLAIQDPSVVARVDSWERKERDLRR